MQLWFTTLLVKQFKYCPSIKTSGVTFASWAAGSCARQRSDPITGTRKDTN